MKRIKSPISLNQICSYFLYSKTLNLVKHSKSTQKHFNIDINDYIIYSQLKELIQKDEYYNMGWYYDYLCVNYPKVDKEKIKKCLFEYFIYYTRYCHKLTLNLLHHLTLEIVNQSSIEKIYLVIPLRELITNGNICLIDKKNIIGIDIRLGFEDKINEELINSLFNNIIGNSVIKLHLYTPPIENHNTKKLLLSKIENLNPDLEELTINKRLFIDKNSNLDSILVRYSKIKKLFLFVPMIKIKFNSIKTLLQTMTSLTEIAITCDVLKYSQFQELISCKNTIKKIRLFNLLIDITEKHFSTFTSLQKLVLINTKQNAYLNLSGLSSLKYLSLEETPITSDNLIDTLLSCKSTIEYLSLSYGKIKTINKSKEDFLLIIPSLTSLKILFIYEFFSKDVNQNKRFIIASNSIEKINLEIANGFNIKELFDKCPLLKDVSFYYAPHICKSNEMILDLPTNIDNLESLELRRFKNALLFPSQFTFNPPIKLKCLKIDETCVNEYMIKFINRLCSKSKSITQLSLWSPMIDNYLPFVNCISQIINNSKYLRDFSIVYTCMSDEMMKELLVSLKHCTLLQQIKINNTIIGNESINQLIENKESWSSLLRLEIDNDYMSDEPCDLTELSNYYNILNK